MIVEPGQLPELPIRFPPCRGVPTALAVGLWASLFSLAAGDVVVLRNRTSSVLAYRLEAGRLEETGQTSRSGELAVGEVASVPCRGPGRLVWPGGQEQAWANAAYDFIAADSGEVRLFELPLGRDRRTALGTGVPDSPNARVDPTSLDTVVTVPVKILVDQEQRAAHKVWEPRLRKRVEEASKIFQRQCRVKFRVVAVETWESSARLHQFGAAVRQFQQSVDPAPAQIAIGFTSQYRQPDKRFHLGATRGAFFSHILIREWTQHVGESERLEVLVHELGHVLGAVHSAETTSVMRPVLGDRQARRKSFRIQFDPGNVLAMHLIREEIAHRGVFALADVTPATRLRLGQLYTALDQALPTDPAAKRVLARTLGPQVHQTRQVLRAMVARAERRDPALPSDEMTNEYVRAAAAEAARLAPEEGRAAFLLALGIGLDTSGALRRNPATRKFVTAVESDTEWRTRVAALGRPAFHGRHDFCQHFSISAYLTASAGRRIADLAGLGKELIDLARAGAFSFRDLAADEAGATFARAIATGTIELPTVADGFQTVHFMPQVDHLPDRLTWQNFVQDYGSLSDSRFRQVQQEIRESVEALPPYTQLLSSESE